MTSAALALVLLIVIVTLMAVNGDEHSLLYLYTIQSKTSDSKTYHCSAVTLLNHRQIDFYNSSTAEIRTPKQTWLKNISESDWKTSTKKLQYDTQLLKRLLFTQMDEFGDPKSDGHVLQWRHGCDGERSSDGSVTVLNSINEFGYDGEDLIQFNCTSKIWLTPEEKKNRERGEKWSKIYHAVRKCEQCEDILKMYLQYNTTDLTPSNTPPAVYMFVKKSVGDSSKLILTCMATGFYPKDVKMSLRKSGTEIPEHLVTSSGVRPNDDGTYQLRKSVEIPEDDSVDYYCNVSHSSLRGPINKQWDNSSLGVMIGVWVTVVLLVVILILVIIWVLKKNGIICQSHPDIHGRVGYSRVLTGDQSSAGSGSNGNVSLEDTSHNQTDTSLSSCCQSSCRFIRLDEREADAGGKFLYWIPHRRDWRRPDSRN